MLYFNFRNKMYQNTNFCQEMSAENKMTSSNGNIFRVTGHLCGEFTGHRWIPRTKASDAELWYFFFICAWINGWVNNRDAGDLRRHLAHCDVIVMNVCHFVQPWIWYVPCVTLPVDILYISHHTMDMLWEKFQWILPLYMKPISFQSKASVVCSVTAAIFIDFCLKKLNVFSQHIGKKTNEYLNSSEQIPRNWNVDQLSMLITS